MKIELSNEQYRDLVMLVCLGDWVRGDVADQRGENSDRWKKIKERVLFAAINENIPGIAELFHGTIMTTDNLSHEYEEMLDEYNNEIFWHELSLRLGQRDYEREATKEDIGYTESHYGMLPEKVHKYYKKYDDEFEDNGIERLEIKE